MKKEKSNLTAAKIMVVGFFVAILLGSLLLWLPVSSAPGVKTSYIDEIISVEKRTIPELIIDEIKINRILDKLKENKVTPVSVEYVIEDLLKENC